MFNWLANIASIVTLLLFLLYIVGRIIRIQNERRIWKDKIVINSEEFSDYGIVDEVYVEGTDDPIGGLLVSTEGIRDLRVYSVTYDEKICNTSKSKLIYSKEFLNVDEAVSFHVQTGELFPTLIIEYLTKDYLKVEIEWRDNLKSGVMSEFIQPKHTWKSIVYYLLA